MMTIAMPRLCEAAAAELEEDVLVIDYDDDDINSPAL
jgi:hypothetical protein